MSDGENDNNNLDPSARPKRVFHGVQGVNQRLLVSPGVQTVDDEADEAIGCFNLALVLQGAGGKKEILENLTFSMFWDLAGLSTLQVELIVAVTPLRTFYL